MPMHKWKKGDPSPNPKGRPRNGTGRAEFIEWAGVARATLVQIMLNKNAKSSARVKAASIILDRAYGKVTQTIEVIPDEKPRANLSALSLEDLQALYAIRNKMAIAAVETESEPAVEVEAVPVEESEEDV